MKGNFYSCCLVLYMDLILQEMSLQKKFKNVLRAEFRNEYLKFVNAYIKISI